MYTTHSHIDDKEVRDCTHAFVLVYNPDHQSVAK